MRITSAENTINVALKDTEVTMNQAKRMRFTSAENTINVALKDTEVTMHYYTRLRQVF